MKVKAINKQNTWTSQVFDSGLVFGSVRGWADAVGYTVPTPNRRSFGVWTVR